MLSFSFGHYALFGVKINKKNTKMQYLSIIHKSFCHSVLRTVSYWERRSTNVKCYVKFREEGKSLNTLFLISEEN